MKDYYDGERSFSTYRIIDCPYKNKCTSANSFKCLSCRNNRGKRDYYDPEPYRPLVPWPEPWKPEPYQPFKPIWTITCSKNTPRFAD